MSVFRPCGTGAANRRAQAADAGVFLVSDPTYLPFDPARNSDTSERNNALDTSEGGPYCRHEVAALLWGGIAARGERDTRCGRPKGQLFSYLHSFLRARPA